MKILYVGTERTDAQAVATALGGIDRHVDVSWASHLDQAVRWLDEHRDASALVVESQVDEGRWPSVLSRVHAGASAAALLVILPNGASSAFDALDPTADDYIARNASLLRDLPTAVLRAIVRAGERRRGDVEQRLAQATTALQDAEHRHRAVLVAAEAKLADTRAQFEIGMARATANWDMVDEQLREAALHVERSRQSRADAVAEVERLTRQQSDIASRLAQAQETNAALEQRITDVNAAVEAANARTDDERRSADERLTEHQHEFESRLAEELDQRRSVQDSLAHASAELADTQQKLEGLMARESELAAQLADLTATRSDLERRLTATQAAFDDATTRATRDRLSASKRAAAREAELDGQIQRERVARTSLEQAMADAQATLTQAEGRHQQALAAAASDLAERHARFDRELSDVAAARAQLADQLTETRTALDQVRQDHASAVADVARLAHSETTLTSQLADLQATRQALDVQLDDAASALQRAAAHEAELADEIQRERATRSSLEQAIADADAALRHAEQQHQDAIAASASDLAERQAHFDRELSDAASDRARLAERLNERDAALDHARHDHQSAVAQIERLTLHEADLRSQLGDLQAARQALDVQLVDAATALQRSSARENELEEEIQRGRASQAALEQAIADGEDARRDAQQRHEAAITAAAIDLAEHQARFERELSQTASDRDRVAELLTDADAALDRSQRDHAAAVATIARLEQREADLIAQHAEAQAARHSLEIQLADAASAIAEEIAGRDGLERTLADARSTALDTQRALQEQADALRAEGVEQRARFDVQLSQERLEHETRLADAQHNTRAMTGERDALQQSLATAQRQSQELRAKLGEAVQALEIAKRHQDLLQAELDQLPRLRKEIDDHRAESHRLFDQAGLAMFRCTPNGALTQTNRACATLVGRRALDELPAAQFAATVFESPNVLKWLIERCVNTHSKESVETTWRRQDAARLFVRLSARWTPSNVIEVAVEDLTRVRVLQERLGQAHRMEAVGRFASEVAATCGHLLDDIQEQGREWLQAARVDADSKQQAEQLITEVGRAAGFVRQLAECGDEQVRTPMLVDLNTAIRDLEPVLKRVAGGDVEVQLRDTSSPLMVDLATERVERLLVNLASYGRQCMPTGGRLKIELGTVVVDRHFVAKHPNVRMGVHALITVTETKRASRADGPQPRDGTAANRTPGRAVAKPGVDFTTLHGLVNECGGHLWMKVQPQGGMEAKIRLPLVSTHDQPQTRPVAVRSGLAARLFQS